MEHSRKNIIQSLISKIGFTSPDPFTQEWECDVADSTRIRELIEACKSHKLTPGEKFTLMSVVIHSVDESLVLGTIDDNDTEDIIKCISKDYMLYLPILEDWANWDEADPQYVDDMNLLIRKIDGVAREANSLPARD